MEGEIFFYLQHIFTKLEKGKCAAYIWGPLRNAKILTTRVNLLRRSPVPQLCHGRNPRQTLLKKALIKVLYPGINLRNLLRTPCIPREEFWTIALFLSSFLLFTIKLKKVVIFQYLRHLKKKMVLSKRTRKLV